MNELLWLGGGGLAAYLLLRHKDAAAATPRPATPPNAGMQSVPPGAPIPISASAPQITTPAPPFTGEVKPIVLTGRWGWPVPRWQGRSPVISDGFGSPRPPATHKGVDLMFGRIASDPFPIGPNGSKAFVMPDAWMAVAASDGVLWSAGNTPRGFAVVIDHGTVATFYGHIETLLVPETKPPAKGTPKEQLIPIKAGQPLGVIGGDPLDPSHLKHLHFELWLGGPTSAIDPQPLMKAWQVFTPDDVAPFLHAMQRNASKHRPAKQGPATRSEFVAVRGYERRWPGTALHPPR